MYTTLNPIWYWLKAVATSGSHASRPPGWAGKSLGCRNWHNFHVGQQALQEVSSYGFVICQPIPYECQVMQRLYATGAKCNHTGFATGFLLLLRMARSRPSMSSLMVQASHAACQTLFSSSWLKHKLGQLHMSKLFVWDTEFFIVSFDLCDGAIGRHFASLILCRHDISLHTALQK